MDVSLTCLLGILQKLLKRSWSVCLEDADLSQPLPWTRTANTPTLQICRTTTKFMFTTWLLKTRGMAGLLLYVLLKALTDFRSTQFKFLMALRISWQQEKSVIWCTGLSAKAPQRPWLVRTYQLALNQVPISTSPAWLKIKHLLQLLWLHARLVKSLYSEVMALKLVNPISVTLSLSTVWILSNILLESSFSLVVTTALSRSERLNRLLF